MENEDEDGLLSVSASGGEGEEKVY